MTSCVGFLDGLRRIGTAIHYPLPVHRQPAYRDRGLNAGTLGRTEKLCDEILSLPMFPQLTDADVDRVSSAIGEWLERRRPAQGFVAVNTADQS